MRYEQNIGSMTAGLSALWCQVTLCMYVCFLGGNSTEGFRSSRSFDKNQAVKGKQDNGKQS